MNIKRIASWIGFFVLVGLVIWGLIVANTRPPRPMRVVSLPDPVTVADWSLGSTTADTVLVEYSDFQCPSCALYHPLLEKLVLEHGSQFRFVYRHFPLPQHKNAVPAAIASEAAGKQGKFWEMHKQIFEHQADWSELAGAAATDAFISYAEKIGLDMAQFRADLSDKTIAEKVSGSFAIARKAGIPGTPALFLNGVLINTPPNYESLVSLISKNK